MFGAQTGPPRRSNRFAGWTRIIALTSPLVSLSVLVTPFPDVYLARLADDRQA
jgi:hypothetical protein